jgi:Zn ribbon nucleic-acid-binding protein
MIECTKCGNETRTAALVVALGEVMVTGPGGTAPLPVSAQVCVACGHIDLYAPQHFEQPQEQAERAVPLEEVVQQGIPAA